MTTLTVQPPTRLLGLIESIRSVVARETSERDIANGIGALLSQELHVDLLAPEQRQPTSGSIAHHLLHAEVDGSFSIVAIAWLPGQATAIHDHLCWCVVGVIAGQEVETNYRLTRDDGAARLEVADRRFFRAGTVSVLLPPGDIHRVSNEGDGVTVSLHVYGANLTDIRSSIRRSYLEPS